MQAKVNFNQFDRVWEVWVDDRNVERFDSAEEAQDFADFVNSCAE